jgi:hypothetical protein
MTGEGSGRAAIWYGDPDSVINGVRTTDDNRKPRPAGWNQRQWVLTPFGRTTFSGVFVRNCRGCGYQLWPIHSCVCEGV